MKKIYSLLSLLSVLAITGTSVQAQLLPVYTCTFAPTLASGTAYGTPGEVYTTSTVAAGSSYTTTLLSGGGYSVNINSGTSASDDYFYAPMAAYSSPFSLTPDLNPAMVIWTLNMRTSNAVTASAPTSGSVSGGVDLCGNAAANIYSGAPTGYGVVFNSGTAGGVSLVSFSAGMHTINTTMITQNTSTLSKTDYYSVEVTYNPTNNQWALYTRDDGASTFANPASTATGALVLQGTTTNTTYAATAMVNFGVVYGWTSGTGKSMSIANYSVSLAECVTPAPGNTVTSANNFCPGLTTTLSLQNATGGLGVTYQWYAAPDVSGTPGSYTAVSGATSATYTATVPATYWYYCQVSCSYGSTSTNSTAVKVTTLAGPPAITGSASVCIGTSSTFADAATGGTWSSVNTTVATITSSGVVSGFALGVSVISYVAPGIACPAMVQATVNPYPVSTIITPATYLPICPGASTTPTATASLPSPVTLLSNNFNATPSGLVGQVGGTWTIVNTGASTPYNWAIVTSSYSDFTITGDGTAFAYADADEYSGGTIVSSLITPSFSTVGYTSANLTQNYYCESETGLDIKTEIDYSTNGGSTWTQLHSFFNTTSGTTTWSAATPTITIALPVAALGQPSVMLRWYYDSDFGWYWAVDNVVVSAVPPALPSSAYTWTGPSGLSCTNCASPTISPTVAGSNIYTVVASNAGCTASNTVNVNVVVPGPITGNAPVCFGNTFTVYDTSIAGAWSSSNTAMASVGSTTGIITAGATSGNPVITFTSPLGCASTVVLTVNPLPSISATAMPAAICVGSILSLNATPSGGSGTYSSYSWTGPSGYTAALQNTNIVGIALSGAGIYSVSVTDNNGCISASPGITGSVTVNPVPTITATATPTPICPGTTLALNAIPANGSGTYASYSWSGPGGFTATTQNAGNAGITAGGAGVYNVTVTDADGCTSLTGVTASVVVYPMPVITTTATPSPICASSTLSLNATPAGGSGIYLIYAWSGPGGFTASTQNTARASIAAGGAGIYSVTVTDTHGCLSSPGVTTAVTVNALPTITAAATPNPVCQGTSLSLNATPSGGSGTYSAYSWNGPGSYIASGQSVSNPGMSATGAGIYSVSVTDNNGCTSAAAGTTASVAVNTAPVITATVSPTTICAGSTLGLNATPASGSGIYSSYSWTGPGGYTASTQSATNPGISAAGAGIYSVSVTDNNGCTSLAAGISAAVTVNPVPNVTSFSVPSATSLCLGGTSTVTINSSSLASATFTATYNLTGANTATGLTVTLVMAAGAGTFTIPSADLVNTGTTTVSVTSITNSLGCNSSLSTGNYAIFAVNPLPKVINGSTSLCLLSVATLSDTTTLGAWSSSNTAVATIGSSTGFLTGSAIGTAIITYTLPTGCINTTPVIVNPVPNVYIVTGGGAFCSTSPAVHVRLTGSDAGASYQVYANSTPTGSLITGTGVGPLDLGPQTISGTYTVVANPSATCARTMTGSVTVNDNLAPSVYTVTGGGVYCAGGTGVPIGVNYGQDSMSYQLYNGVSPTGSPVTGSGYTLSFGPETGTGSYTVIATNPANGCTTTMTGSVTVTTNPLPAAITGTASVCVGLATPLFDGTSGGSWSSGNTALATVGISSGLVSGISAGLPLITYTLPTGCMMSSQITVNPLPAAITGVLSNVCFGSTITLADGTSGGTWSSGSASVAAVGSATGVVTSGLAAGTAAITYTLPTGCITASVITLNALPTITNVTGGGAYCAGGSGMHIGLSGSATGVNYQLFNGATASGSPVSGTGSPVDFGAQTVNGTYTAVATNTITGCTSNMAGSASIAINPLPAIATLFGGGSLCAGSTGVDISLSSTTPGISYQLFDASTPIGGAVSGTGSSYDYGLQTAAGAYGVIATNPLTGCYVAMSGSPVVTVLPLPTAYAVSGGGGYCTGGSGVPIYLSSSAAGISYQVVSSGGSVGAPVSGTGSSINFGQFTTAGVYTVTATNTTTTCSNSMSGSATVTVNPLPVSTYSVTGGGSYCSGASSTSSISLSNSVIGTSYQLYVGGSPAGSPVVSTATGLINFGVEPTAGAYTVVATIPGTGCSATMTGSASISVTALPAIFSVTGGGGYCTGTTSTVHVGLNASASGVNYQLYNGTTAVTGGLLSGTGAALDFGSLPAGTYTVKATTTTTGCISNMSGSASITTNPLPASFTVSASTPSSYCVGSPAPHVLLSGSATGVTYQVIYGGAVVGSGSGSGSALDLGAQTATGTYTATATIAATGCTTSMTGSASITANPLPVSTYSVTGGGVYCYGGSGEVVTLSGSTSGISYQLYVNGVATGTAITATGVLFSYPLQTAVGAYTILATNTATSCNSYMTGSVSISTTPAPVVYNVTGGGGYCTGTTTGIHIGLSSSTAGISYQLFISGTTAVGAPVTGAGGAIDFGAQTTTGTYTVVATNTTTLCTSNMFGTAVVSTVLPPAVYAISASGSYCLGTGGWPVSLGNSAVGVNYQLLLGGIPLGSPVAGTGSALSFGNQTSAGNYTIFATNATGCSSNMTGIATISINPLPAMFNVTSPATAYCTGDTGVHIGLNSSATGFSYQLYNAGIADGLAVAGTGGALDFGLQTAGVYTVIASNGTTSCTNNMSGMIVVTANPLPTQYAVTGAGNYCSGGSGLDVGLANSNTGISYQLFMGTLPVGFALPGTGLPLNFGLQTTAGTYTVIATNTTTGCTQNMTGSAVIGISALPALHNVLGGGNYCIGGTGLDVYIDGSNTGISYQLYNGTNPSGPAMPGTGLAVHFGLQTIAGTYIVVATNSASCSDNMTGSVTISIAPLPVVYTATGGGNFCPSGTGVPVELSGSDAGVHYRLYDDMVSVGTVTGTGSSIDFGLQTDTGSYTVVASNPTTSCTNNMSGIVSIGYYPLPTAYSVTGGGSYCAGGTGMTVGTSSSDAGVAYQLYESSLPLGAPLAGTGLPINFGLQTGAGMYTVIATNTSTTCTNSLAGTAVIAINPLPDTASVTGGGAYCASGEGVPVGLRSSVFGTSYQLYEGSIASGLPVAGTGGAITFALETTAGIYMAVATNTGTTCTNNMPGSATVSINPLPVAYAVTGGGNYCPGGAGMHVGLSHSDAGITYQLYNGVVATGVILTGTGSALDFGLITAPGTYKIEALNAATSCTANMTGSVVIAINPVPTAYITSAGASQYCEGGSGVNILLSGSAIGTNYQLYFGAVATGAPVAGTGIPLNFGLHTAAGAYTVIATNATTGCVNNMTGSASFTISPLPAVYSVVGGGNYCPGGAGVHVGLSNSDPGISYQLYNGIDSMGSPVTGTGFAIDFGAQTETGGYTIVATNPSTGCTINMTGGATVDFNPPPAVNTVIGGGGYCASGTGVSIGLSGSSTGITYQLYNDTTAVGIPVTGTGTFLSFGLYTTTGTYTAVATSAATGCTNNMAGSAVVIINSLPTPYTIAGGGNYCAGSTAPDISLPGSALGVNYQLYNGSIPVGAYLPGTGFALDFGIHSAAGSYTLIATNTATGCINNMPGAATIVENSAPTAYDVIGGGSYCASGSGVHVGLTNSDGGVNYQLFDDGTPSGVAASGTGSSLDFGLLTPVGAYSVVATNATTGCSANMSGTATITVNPLLTPAISLLTSTGDTVCAGTSVMISTSAINEGASPVYTWTVNGITVTAATGSSYTYTPAPGDIVGITMTSSAPCATPATASAMLPFTVLPHGMPSITISSSPGDVVCQGTSVTFTEAMEYGGTAPSLSWRINGTQESMASSYTYAPLTGQVVTCVLTSNYQCRLATYAYSNVLNMEVDNPVTPSVTIDANPGTDILQGQTLVLTAVIANSVISPTFQWYQNGEPIFGATAQAFSTTSYSNLDSFSCVVTSGGGCSGLIGSNSAVIHLSSEGVSQVTASGSDIRIVPNPNNGMFTIKGSLGTTADEQVSVEILDLLGQVIYSDKIMAHGGSIDQRIQLSNTLANGMYILNLHSAGANDVFHVVIEQ